MRESMNNLSYYVRKDLTGNEKNLEEVVYSLIRIELVAVALDLLDIKLPLYQAWILLTGYNEPIIKQVKDEAVLMRFRMLFPSTFGEDIWKKLYEQYKTIPKKYRMLEIVDDDKFNIIESDTFNNRKEIYYNTLTNPIKYRKVNSEFLNALSFEYLKYDYNRKKTETGIIPQTWLNSSYSLLEKYKKKKRVKFSLNEDWITIAREMDTMLQNNDQEWEKKITPITLQSLNNKSFFKYRKLQHIVGGLASGKSTFKLVQTYWLVKHKKMKVGLVEGSVAEVIKTVSLLKRLGIKAVPIIGRSMRQIHQDNYLASKNFSSFNDISNDESLSYLSTICTIKTLADDDSKDRYYPCESLLDNNKRYICPIADKCGIYQQWTNLQDADVWVTTSAAILKSRLPATIDLYKRFMYEAMYDLLDVIFVDEADSVMQKFEETFMTEYEAFGSPNFLVEKLELQFNNMTKGTYNYVSDLFLNDWESNLTELKRAIKNLLSLLRSTKSIRDEFKKRVIYLNHFIFQIAIKLGKDESHQEEIAKLMRKIAREARFDILARSNQTLFRILHTNEKEEKHKIIKQWISEINVQEPQNNFEKEELYTEIESFIYLAHIEAALKYIKYNYHSIENLSESDVNPILYSIKDFRPLLKEAMTGIMFGYRYEQSENNSLGQFKVQQYLQVGRELLYKWDSIYEKADKIKGPAVILLSGTSFAPQSSHYHIEQEPQWIITSTRQKSTLEQHFLERRFPTSLEPIHISGIPNQDERDHHLKVLVEELRPIIESELNHWKQQQRRVLLVVNSYDDLEVVGNALDTIGFKRKYRLLTNHKKKDNVWFPRSQIEDFSYENADILVAPLLAISRGYNIMNHRSQQKVKGALFGSAFFLIRPYPSPNNFSYYVQNLHAMLPNMLNEINNKNKYFEEAIRSLRQMSRKEFERMYRYPDYWSILSKKKREIVAWYTFIPVWQLIGRLLRGGSDARVFYCDAKFNDRGTGQFSLLETWDNMLNSKENVVFEQLYGPFKNSIGNAIKERV